MRYFIPIFLTFIILSCTTKPNSNSIDKPNASYKRKAPKEVQAILIDHIEYTASMSEIIATDTLTKKVLWKKEIYKIAYDKNLEKDVQDIYIDSVSYQDNSLIIRNEKNEFYFLNLETMDVKKK